MTAQVRLTKFYRSRHMTFCSQLARFSSRNSARAGMLARFSSLHITRCRQLGRISAHFLAVPRHLNQPTSFITALAAFTSQSSHFFFLPLRGITLGPQLFLLLSHHSRHTFFSYRCAASHSAHNFSCCFHITVVTFFFLTAARHLTQPTTFPAAFTSQSSHFFFLPLRGIQPSPQLLLDTIFTLIHLLSRVIICAHHFVFNNSNSKFMSVKLHQSSFKYVSC